MDVLLSEELRIMGRVVFESWVCHDLALPRPGIFFIWATQRSYQLHGCNLNEKQHATISHLNDV